MPRRFILDGNQYIISCSMIWQLFPYVHSVLLACSSSIPRVPSSKFSVTFIAMVKFLILPQPSERPDTFDPFIPAVHRSLLWNLHRHLAGQAECEARLRVLQRDSDQQHARPHESGGQRTLLASHLDSDLYIGPERTVSVSSFTVTVVE